jgi:hypothetical protein
LVAVEGEEFLRAEFEGGGDVEDVEAAVAAGEGAGFGDALAGDEDVDEIITRKEVSG